MIVINGWVANGCVPEASMQLNENNNKRFNSYNSNKDACGEYIHGGPKSH